MNIRYKTVMKKSNEEKAKEIAHEYFRRGQLGLAAIDTESAGYDCAMQAMELKDRQFQKVLDYVEICYGVFCFEQRSNFINCIKDIFFEKEKSDQKGEEL